MTESENKHQTSIYAIGAVTKPVTGKKPTLADITLLNRNPEQLLYVYRFLDQKPSKERVWRISVQEKVGGQLIKTKDDFADFVGIYFDDKKALEKGQVPAKLATDFYAFKHQADAKEALTQLRQKQAKSYQSLFKIMQPYAPQPKLVIVDLLVELANFVPSILKEIMADPKSKAIFEKNMSKFKQNNDETNQEP